MKPLLAFALSVLVAACGGGGGASAGAVQPAPVAQRTDLLFGYYGSTDNPANFLVAPAAATTPSSVAETGRHVNALMTGPWGNRSTPEGRAAIAATAIRHMQEAQGFGVHAIVVSVEFLLFDDAHRYRGQDAMADVLIFLDQMRVAGVLADVVALYPLDEPNVNATLGVPDAIAGLRVLLAAAPDTAGIKLFAIYGPARFGFADVQDFDWIGLDDYALAAGVLGEIDADLRPKLTAKQALVLVPGGGDPWQDDPQPFIDYANTHPDVVAIVPFVWFTIGDQKGIRDNARREAYVRAGCLIRYGGACP